MSKHIKLPPFGRAGVGVYLHFHPYFLKLLEVFFAPQQLACGHGVVMVVKVEAGSDGELRAGR